MLLDAGADVNAQAGQHGSALQAALKRDHVDEALTKLLIDAGADVNAMDECHDKSCLHRDDRPDGELMSRGYS